MSFIPCPCLAVSVDLPACVADHRLCQVIYQVAEASHRARINFAYGTDIPMWKGRHRDWDCIASAATPAAFIVRLFWFGYLMWRQPLDDPDRSRNVDMIKDTTRFVLEDDTIAIWSKAEDLLFPVDPTVSEVPPAFEEALLEWEIACELESLDID